MFTFFQRRWVLGLWIGQVLAGGFLFTHYGEAWDDASMLASARNVLQALETFFQIGTWPGVRYPVPVLEFYGVWPWVLVVVLHRLATSLYVVDVVHAVAYAFFCGGTAALYHVLRRWFSTEAALIATLLFATQPLLLGHSFINLKDTSAWSMMLVSLYWVLRFADTLPEQIHKHFSGVSLSPSFQWRIPSSKLLWALGLVAALILSILIAFGYAYLGSPAPSDLWYSRALRTHRIFTQVLGGVTFLLLSLGWTWCLGSTPAERRVLRRELRAYSELTRELLRKPLFWGAALALGLSVSVRISGWWVWIVVLILMWKALRIRSVFPFSLLAIAALGIHYFTHPSLFLRSPSYVIFFYGISLRIASQFLWPGKTLFAGRFYSVTELPFWYVPWLHLIQTTEPVLFLAFLGLWALWRKSEFGPPRFVFGLWYALPVALLMTRTPPLYDNARQLLFLLPGLYIPVAAGWETLRARLGAPWRFFLVSLSLAPALMAWVQLHPYEYVYYNALVGGVRGAFRRYEMDYWATSFREVASFLNQQVCISKARNTQQGLRAVTWEPVEPLADFLCPEFRVFSCHDVARPRERFFAVLSTRYNADLVKFPHVPDQYRVERAGAVLSVVRFVERDPTPPDFDGVSCLPKELTLEELSSP